MKNQEFETSHRVLQWFKDHGIDPASIDPSTIVVEGDSNIAQVTWKGYLPLSVEDALDLVNAYRRDVEGAEEDLSLDYIQTMVQAQDIAMANDIDIELPQKLL